ncbi:MAG TPA: hypothetical protein VGL82_10605 [Bryobacteraceae bacterium]
MHGDQYALMTRRGWVAAASAGFGFVAASELFGASDFWNKKDPSAWTSDEILQLATRSPWARTGQVLPKPGRDRGSFGRSIPDLGGGGGGRSENPKTGEVPVLPVTEVTVVWASAKPLLDALRTSFPADFANHYVIGVNDLPEDQGGRKVDRENMGANLKIRGKDSVDAGGNLQTRETILFPFSKELLPLTVADKEAVFTLDANEFSVKVRFDLKEMMYRGKLAV